MELKVLCDCGQKYKFEVEPANGLMPYQVNCPVCGTDGTPAANTLIAQSRPTPPALPPPLPPRTATAAPLANRLAISQPAHVSAPAALPPAPALKPIAAAPPAKAAGQFNLGMGILGAVLSAALGGGLMYGFSVWAGFRFPFLGVGVGLLTAYGARLLGKGSDQVLSILSAVIAAASVVGTLFLIYGDFPIISIISVVVSASVAYRVANR